MNKAGRDIRSLMRVGGAYVVDSGQLPDTLKNLAFILHLHIVCDFGDTGDHYLQVSGEEMEFLRSSHSHLQTRVVSMPWISDCLFSGTCPPPSVDRSESLSGYSASEADA